VGAPERKRKGQNGKGRKKGRKNIATKTKIKKNGK